MPAPTESDGAKMPPGMPLIDDSSRRQKFQRPEMMIERLGAMDDGARLLIARAIDHVARGQPAERDPQSAEPWQKERDSV